MTTFDVNFAPEILRSLVWNRVWSTINSMETIQIVLDTKLLQAADRAARRMKQNRSALVRDALRAHLRGLENRLREEKDREGYRTRPQDAAELGAWEPEAAWPEE